MDVEKNKAIAIKWFDAFNKHDINLLLILYDEDAQHFSPKLKLRSPETEGLIKGKNALYAWWNDAFERLPTLRYELVNLVADKNTVFMEYTRFVSGEENLKIGEVLEIRNGLIVFSRVYHG